MKTIALALLASSLAFAASKSYTVNVWQPTMLSGKELTKGEYRLDVDGDKVRLKAGKQVVEASVKVESTGAKNRSTTLVMLEQDGKLHIKEILLGGSDTKLVIN